MSTTFTTQGTFVIIHCYKCGVPFAMTDDMDGCRRKDHKTFYCPNGHGQIYTGETEAQRLSHLLDHEKARNTHLADQLDSTKKSRAAYKGQITKTKKRIQHGVCPCCNRTFADLAKHMENKHPKYASDAE